MRPSQGFWETGEKDVITGEQRPNFEGKGKQSQYWGTGERAKLFQGNKGTGIPQGGPQQGILFVAETSKLEIDICIRA